MSRLKKLREQRILTLQELSDALKEQMGIYISPASLGKYESGDRKPKIDELEVLAEFYDTSVAYLRENDNSKSNSKKEELKQVFADEVKKASSFYLKTTYKKEKIDKISVIYNFGYDQKVFTVYCLSNDEDMFQVRRIKLGKKIELTAKEAIELSHLLQDAGYLIDSLNKLDKGENNEEQ